jgi:hypothetical protein
MTIYSQKYGLFFSHVAKNVGSNLRKTLLPLDASVVEHATHDALNVVNLCNHSGVFFK